MGAMFAAPYGGAIEINNLACAWLGRQDSNLRMPVPKTASSLPKTAEIHGRSKA